jgi:FAD/FMN-containing dehydrogenase
LNVKGSGHDYLGRSTAANSLSIWTKHIRGIEFHDSFQPQGCHDCDSVPAATLGSGEDWGQLYPAAHKLGRTFVGGTGDTIGLGGYLTGGGHSPLSAMLGLAVDQVLEMEVVMPCGKTVIANQVLNADLFWAMRGVSRTPYTAYHLLKSLNPGRRSNVRCHDFCHPQDVSRNALCICISLNRCSARQ